ncbi:hypothetical protein [Thermocrinis minervae]|uniref:Uncharacterized protein n=1 Tax=Thermocrinis minervae TaxID=381751 RepID=A0A1M6QY46_9AQUI|nr:hypothetical protein [Thermocrinis minervae]SHK25134.1 hypothetical protein SAMN05444391_0444 [Thermocrinis minervae]
MIYPIIREEEDKIVVIYSDKEAEYCEEDDGLLIFYSKMWEPVKIIIPRDDKHNLIYL